MGFKKHHFLSQQLTFSSPSQHLLAILSSLLPFTGNLPSIRRPKLLYRCLATTDLLVGLVSQPLAASSWMFITHEHWIPCRYVSTAAVITSHVLSGVSFLTMTAISVDRLLALSLGLRYRYIVTFKRTSIVVVTFWVQSSVAALCYALDYRIYIWYGITVISLSYVISIVSYTKIFCALNHHHTQIQDHVQQQPSQPNAVNTAQYKKAVYNALWVQLALIVCYFPYYYGLVEIAIRQSKIYSSHLVIRAGNSRSQFKGKSEAASEEK